MSKIITLDQIENSIKTYGRKLIVAGGCFDILHVGHIRFLNRAKETGDIVVVLLESDEAIKARKGEKRPINRQEDRAEILAALSSVDYILRLPLFTSDRQYDALLSQLKPAIIATTKGDKNRFHKERQAKLIGAEVLDVIDYQASYGTSTLIEKTKI